MKGLACSGYASEKFSPFLQFPFILPGDFIFSGGIFHLTQVNYLIPAVYHKIYLRSLMVLVG